MKAAREEAGCAALPGEEVGCAALPEAGCSALLSAAPSVRHAPLPEQRFMAVLEELLQTATETEMAAMH